ncbi:hypothetical protein H8D57_00135, partial [bacterium]|nr:hypothetical protein [bacterium]
MKINIYILVCLIIGAQTSTIAQNSSIPIEETQIQPAQSVQPPRKSRNNNQNEVYRLSKLARNAESANKFERALGLWKQAHEINPGYQSAYSGVKRCLLGLKKPDEALQFVNSMIELSLTGKTSLDPAKIAADKIEVIFAFGNDSLAWVEIENLLAEFKGNQKLHYNLSNVLAAQRLTEEPIEMLLRGRRECGNKFLFAKNLARWHENRMNWESATQEYLLYLEESPQRLNQVVGSLGDIADKLEIDSTIARTVNKWIDREKGDFKLLLRKLSALLHFRAKRYDLAFVQYRTLEESNRGQGKELLEFARLVGKEGEHQLAWDAYNEILLTNPGSTLKSSVNLGRGFSAEALGEIDSAYAIYNAVLEPGISVKTAFEVYQRLGDIEFRQYKSAEKGRIYYQKALDILGKARMPVSRIDSIRVNIILTHEYEGNLEETEKLLTNLLKRNRNSRKNLSGARYELVRLLFRTGKINETEENIEIFLTTLPN